MVEEAEAVETIQLKQHTQKARREPEGAFQVQLLQLKLKGSPRPKLSLRARQSKLLPGFRLQLRLKANLVGARRQQAGEA